MNRKIVKGLFVLSFAMVLVACGKSNTYDSAMSKADEAITAKKFTEAKKEVKVALEAKPDDTKAKSYGKQLTLYSDALANMKNKKYDQADKELEELIKIKDGSPVMVSYAKKEQRQITISKAKGDESKETTTTSEKEVKITATIEKEKDSNESSSSEETKSTSSEEQVSEKQVAPVENGKLLAAKVMIKDRGLDSNSVDNLISNLSSIDMIDYPNFEIWTTGVFIEESVTVIGTIPTTEPVVYHNNGDNTVTVYPVPTRYTSPDWSDDTKGPQMAQDIISGARLIDVSDVSDEVAQKLADVMTISQPYNG